MQILLIDALYGALTGEMVTQLDLYGWRHWHQICKRVLEEQVPSSACLTKLFNATVKDVVILNDWKQSRIK